MKRLTILALSATLLFFTQLAYAGGPPQVVSVEPHCGSVPYNNTYPTPEYVKVTFSTTYSDPDGWQDLKQVYMLISATTSAGKLCPIYARYDRDTNKLYIRDWYDFAWVGGGRPGPAPDGGSQWYDNNNCTLYRLQTTVSGSGNNLTVKWVVRFKYGFGLKNIYLTAIDSAGNTTGFVQKGMVVIGTNYAPQAGPVSPASGTNTPDKPVTFTATYNDANGSRDIQDARLLINTNASVANGVCGYYDSFANKLYLANDAGDGRIGGYAPGSANVIENSYGKLDCSQTTVSGSSSALTIAWNVTFKNTFVSQELKNIYLYATDGTGSSTGWVQAGTLMVEQDLSNINLNIPWQQTIAPYNSTGAATAQMILNFIRAAAGVPTLTQDEIYQYAKSYRGYGPDLSPDELDRALGHFDPYDSIVSNWADSYDTKPDGNPYQGYNYSVETFDTNVDSEAMNKYMRDICHWMAYTVTKEDWWLAQELVAAPNTPAAVPIYGSYNHWVVIKGFSASTNPCPEPHTNPWNSPDFTVNGFWMKDPLVAGIGQDTYKTAAECQASYFKPITADDAYKGKLIQIAEPPEKMSGAMVDIPQPVEDMGNLVLIGAAPKTESVSNSPQVAAMASMAVTSASAADIQPRQKTGWRDLVDSNLLADPEAVKAFEGTRLGRYALVTRTDGKGSDYYLVPCGKHPKKRHFIVSGVIILDAISGYFKEASWTDTPEEFLKVDKLDALQIARNHILQDRKTELNNIPKKPVKEYLRRQLEIARKYRIILENLEHAEATLVWEPNKYSMSPYKPYWQVSFNGGMCYVTQEGKVVDPSR